jgi:hypothetical protein
MVRRDRRWLWLTLFALANLVCWVGVAALAGLLVGDTVDIGVEALIRQGQATAMAGWEQVTQRASQPTVVPTSAAQAPMPTKQAPAGGPSPATPTPLPSAQSQSTQETEPSTAVPTVAGNSPTPAPEATLVTSPLLMADPEISTLTRLDAEMSRSAPDRAVQIRYQEDALNSEIATLWVNNPDLPYRDVQLDLQREQVVVTGTVSAWGFDAKVKVTASVSAQDCVPQFEIKSVSVMGVVAPLFVRNQFDKLIAEPTTWYPADYPLCVEQIVVEDTRLTVYGYRR